MTNIVCRERPGLIGDLGQVFGKHGVLIMALKINKNMVKEDSLSRSITGPEEYDKIELEFTLKLNKQYNYQDFNEVILNIPGVEEISWLN